MSSTAPICDSFGKCFARRPSGRVIVLGLSTFLAGFMSTSELIEHHPTADDIFSGALALRTAGNTATRSLSRKLLFRSILSTAVHPRGLPVMAIEPSTLVTVNGLQAPASYWLKEGTLTRAADGTITENTGTPQAAPAEVNADMVPMPADHQAILQAAIGDMPEQRAVSISAVDIGEMVGKLPAGSMLAKLSSLTGLEGQAAA